MPIFKINKDHLEPVRDTKIDLEKDIQSLTEKNLERIFGLAFVSGSLNREFCVTVNEQDFYIDTLAYNESTRSFVIIEYKKSQSFSVIDQGYAYLSAMLSNQAEFVLELNERLHINFGKKDIDWEQSRIIFISPEFTSYQRNAINFKDLPMYLYEVKVYENSLIEYNPIKPYRTSASIKSITKDKTVQSVSSQIKVYTPDDLIKTEWKETKALYEQIREQILIMDGKIAEVTNKQYIAYKLYKNGQWYNFAELCPQAGGITVFLDISNNALSDPRNLSRDCTKVGHWATGNTRFKLTSYDEITYGLKLIKQAYDIILNDENISWHRGSSKVVSQSRVPS